MKMVTPQAHRCVIRAPPFHPGELLDPREVDFATEIVTLRARIVDRFAHPERAEDTVGDVLRARLFEW
jgi:hypothetical protein